MQQRLMVSALLVTTAACGGSTPAELSASPKILFRSNGASITKVEFLVGLQGKLVAVVVDAQGTQIDPQPALSWSATGSHATVDAAGMVKGVSVGENYVKATAQLAGQFVADSILVAVNGLL